MRGAKLWAAAETHEQIIVIDSDQGQSGASAADREGFQKLVTEVGMGEGRQRKLMRHFGQISTRVFVAAGVSHQRERAEEGRHETNYPNR